MQILYHFGLFLYLTAARIAALFNHKARLFVDGRKSLYDRISEEYHPSQPVMWFHCSSAGEFEQARPIIEKMKREGDGYQILLTFFSPSGYELRKDYEYADWVFYLPLDTRRDARRFVEAVHPSIAVFIKYEFWINFLHELKSGNIPVYIACAVFRPGQIFFRWYGWMMRKALTYFERLFVQDERSRMLLSGIGVDNVTVCGDTRFDRVREITMGAGGDGIVQEFSASGSTIVAGSTWRSDEVLISETMPFLPGKTKLVLVPHEVDGGHISSVEKLFSRYGTVRYTVLAGDDDHDSVRKMMSDARVLIVDTVGILSVVYRYAGFAYIGGGFTKSGIHNILEAAVYGVPVTFGPVYGKFREARELIELGGAVSVSVTSDLKNIALMWLTPSPAGKVSEREKASMVCRRYVEANLGAADRIHDLILPR